MSETLKVVFDTQIYLRALANLGSACGRLFSDWTSHYTLYRADAIELEIINVFNRPKVRAKFPQITDDDIETMKKILQKQTVSKLNLKTWKRFAVTQRRYFSGVRESG